MRSIRLASTLALCLALSACGDSPAPDVDAGSMDVDGGSMELDAGSVDMDGGSGDVDAGTPDVDAGTPDVDAGSVDVDAGTPETDAGTPPAMDAGSTTPDAGTTSAPTWAMVHAELATRCTPCHATSFGSGGLGIANTDAAAAYASGQAPSSVCAGVTKAACSAMRIRNGSMPFGGINPLSERNRIADLMDAWVAAGQVGP